jgi:N-methylhydantoinase B
VKISSTPPAKWRASTPPTRRPRWRRRAPEAAAVTDDESGTAMNDTTTRVSGDKAVDPILLSVYARTFKSITDEMSISMQQTTRSPILCEAKDFVTGLYDAEGRMLEQTENLPILAFSLAPVCKHLLHYFGDELHDGDVIFHNDVFSLGNQNNDVAVFKPVFFDGELVAWTAVKGHQADIGGNVAGGYNPNATEVWQEALRIPPVKVYERGKLRKDVWDLIFANIRFDIVRHDMRAEIGACGIGERRVHALFAKYGRASFEVHKHALFDATRRMMEAEIAAIPNGRYSGEGYVYYDGRHDGSKFTIRVDIDVKDRRIKFDYSRTDAQTNGFVNGTFTSSASATVLTLLQMVNPDIPHNEGMVQPIEIVIPEGTILNAAYPKATTFGNHLCPPNADAIIRALAPAIPDRVTAGWNNLLCSLTTGIDPARNEKYVDIGFMGLKGGSGAMRGTDGYDHIGMIDASGGLLDQDYEMFEQQTPHLLVTHEYACDSAGPGQWRGGLGVETVFTIGSEDTQLVTFGDGDFEPAFGLFGGGDGTLNSITLTYPDGRVVVPKNKDLLTGVPKGTTYRQQAGGGGGYGDPAKRDREILRREVRDGVVSARAAHDVYGLPDA